jgi:ABC-2 type transport system permease protein
MLSVLKLDLKRQKKNAVVYMLTSGYLLISGFFFFSLLKIFNPYQRMLHEDAQINLNFNIGVIQPLFETQSALLLFVIPFITMRSFSEEKQSGSLDLLLTTPVSSICIVVSKFLSSFFVIFCAIMSGLVFPFCIYIFGDPEAGPILSSAIGIFLFALAYTAAGLLISVLSASQTISGFIGLTFGVMWLLLDLPLSGMSGGIIDFIKDLSLSQRLHGFFKGTISLSNVFYFIGSMIVLLVLTVQVVSIKREE